MATARDIIYRAARKAGIAAPNDPLQADETADMLASLNGMLHEWKLRAVDISHTDLAINDTFPLGPEFHDGTVYMLAGRIAPDYKAPPMFDADDFFRAIQAAYAEIPDSDMPAALVYAPSQRGRTYY